MYPEHGQFSWEAPNGALFSEVEISIEIYLQLNNYSG
jgi:hypothetical protein